MSSFQMNVKFYILFENLGPSAWRRLECLKSSHLLVLMNWAAMSSAGVVDGWSTVFYEVQSQSSIYQEVSELVMLSCADEPYGDPDFFFLHLPRFNYNLSRATDHLYILLKSWASLHHK